ncbi:site-specific integrase [Brevibacillus sp. AY1]|uniref:site-specific integrase n=1 Tax=Brevibacillus sp. AY1 TaxID=2807621 RepID=UPI0024571B94|nr:site-specific integrase [Brevibacillus sp. AY1]
MDVIQQFEEYLVENGIVPKTIESYVGDVKAFCVQLEGMGVEQSTGLKRFYISSYKNHLMEGMYAVATINKKINSLQAFNLFLIDRKMTTEQVVTLRKDRIKVATGSEGEVDMDQGTDITLDLTLPGPSGCLRSGGFCRRHFWR